MATGRSAVGSAVASRRQTLGPVCACASFASPQDQGWESWLPDWPWREWVGEAVRTLRELPDWGLLGVLLGCALLGGAVLLQCVACVRWLRAYRSRRLGKRGEREARSLLAAAGFSILDAQTTRRYRVRVDGKELQVDLRADFVVERRGATFVAEVKGGPVVNDPLHTPTRRQLLEYEVAFDVDGVLLVDTPRRKIWRVAFPLQR